MKKDTELFPPFICKQPIKGWFHFNVALSPFKESTFGKTQRCFRKMKLEKQKNKGCNLWFCSNSLQMTRSVIPPSVRGCPTSSAILKLSTSHLRLTLAVGPPFYMIWNLLYVSVAAFLPYFSFLWAEVGQEKWMLVS